MQKETSPTNKTAATSEPTEKLAPAATPRHLVRSGRPRVTAAHEPLTPLTELRTSLDEQVRRIMDEIPDYSNPSLITPR